MKHYAGASNFAACLGIGSSDRVIIVSDQQDAYGRILEVLAQECRETGASVELDFSLPRVLADDIPEYLHAKLIASDVIILSAGQSWYQAPFRSRLKREFAKRVVESYDLRLEMLSGGGLCARPETVDAENRKFLSRIGEKREIRLSSPDGTDARMRIRAVGSESGDYRSPGSGGNLPAGEVWMSVLPGSANGTLAFNLSFDCLGRLGRDDLILEYAAGALTRVSGARAAEFEALLGNCPTLANIAEISLGTNPQALAGRNVLEDEKKLGMIHCGFGNDTYFGGQVQGPHLDGVLSGGRLEAGNTIVLDEREFPS
jgi:hypothetical protein